MTKLLHTEWLKMRKYKAFWWMAGIIGLSYPGINYMFHQVYKDIISGDSERSMMVKMLVGNPFTFPEVWHTVAYFSSWFLFIPSVIIIMFITNEYSFKTHRQNVIDGWSRKQFMTSKFIDVVLISLLVTALYAIVALAIGLINKGDSNASIWQGSRYIGLFALQTFSQLSIAFLIAFIARKAFIALGIFLFYFLILENVIVGIARVKANDIGRFMPIEVSDRLITLPAFLAKLDQKAAQNTIDNVGMYLALTVLVTAVTWAFCFAVNKRRDL